MRDRQIRLIGILIFLAYFLIVGIVIQIFNVDTKDPSPTFLIFIFSLFLASVLLICHFFAKSARIQNKNLEKIAQRLRLKFIAPQYNFSFHQGFARVEGKYFDHFIQIKKLASGSEGHTYIELSLELNQPNEARFIIAKNDRIFSGFGPKIKALSLNNMIEEFIVRSKDETSICRILDLEIQSRILKIKSILDGNIQLDKNKLVYTQGKELIKHEDLHNFETIIDTMCHIADKIDNIAEV